MLEGPLRTPRRRLVDRLRNLGLFASLSLVAGCAVPLFPDTVHVTLHGRVTDGADGSPIEGAEVSAYATFSWQARTTQTSAEGQYQLSAEFRWPAVRSSADGCYMSVSAPGYRSEEREIPCSGDWVRDFALWEEAPPGLASD